MSSAPRLSDDDARLLDALAEEGLDPSRLTELPAVDRARAQAILRALAALDHLPAPEPDTALVSRVMERVDELEAERRERMRLAPASIRRRWRVPDVVTIAAVLLLALGVGWPLVQSVRGASWRDQCGRNLAMISSGLAKFSNDHGGELPLAAGFGAFLGGSPAAGGAPPSATTPARGPDWRTYRHGAGLDRLAASEYVGARCLTCPGCAKDRGALALRVPATGQRFTLAAIRGMLVSDANPAIERLCDGGEWRPAAGQCSPNHASLGQNILLDDGTVRWFVSPILPNGDCIWTPRTAGGDSLSPGAMPTDPNDQFLAQ